MQYGLLLVVLVLLWCVPSTRRTRRSLLTMPLPRPRTRRFVGRGEGFDYNALSLSLALALALAVDVQQFNRCQIAKSILYYSIIIVGPFEQTKSQVQGSHEYELLNLPKRQRAKRKVL